MASQREPSGPGLRFEVAVFVFTSLFPLHCYSSCREGCDLALASYYVTDGQTLWEIALLFEMADGDVLPYNNLTSKYFIARNSRVNIPLFNCRCDDGGSLAKTFTYTVQSGDTYFKIATEKYHNLTTPGSLQRANRFPAEQIPIGAHINVTVSCFCGDAGISRDYGLFVTYPLRPGDTLEMVAAAVGFSNLTLLQKYNQGFNFSSGQGIVYVPTKGIQLTSSSSHLRHPEPPLSPLRGPRAVFPDRKPLPAWESIHSAINDHSGPVNPFVFPCVISL